LFADSQASFDFVSDDSNIKIKMAMEQCWKRTDADKTEVLEKSPVTGIFWVTTKFTRFACLPPV
jgi:hypothetical protein